MILSVNWLKKFVPIAGTIDELASLIGERLVEIESIEDLSEVYKGVVVAKVVRCAPLEGSDHLHLTAIDDGGVTPGVERDASGYVQVVCGAPNVREGMLVAWLPPGCVVPETAGTPDPFILTAKSLRGVISNGMLASARELNVYDDHSGIIEIDKEAQPGASFADCYELDDVILTIENKSLTHRPDTFGVIGFAREVAGIQGLPFTNPAWLELDQPQLSVTKPLQAPAVHIDDPALSNRFQVVVLSDVQENSTSSLELQSYIARSGVRPISASVDISNYLMLLSGQPTHAYDYDKVRALAGDDFTMHVRTAHENETLTLLDGKTINLDTSDIVIAAGDVAIGLAGIMGGQSTAVDADTKAVIFEAATFNLYNLRSSQMRHGIFSEAVTRFTKGIPAELSTPVLHEAVRMLQRTTGAQISSLIVDAYPAKHEPIQVQIDEGRINGLLGTRFAAEDIADLLENVGFTVSFKGLTATITVPYWREDIHIPEDIIEEVGRLAGFETIPLTLPARDFSAVRPSRFDELRAVLRNLLARSGATEVLTYSFVHSDLLKRAGQDPVDAYTIVNSISPELQHFRQSLTPSLLSHVHANSKSGYDSFALFESNKVHQKSWGMTDEAVPVEEDRIGYVRASSKPGQDPFYSAKRTLVYMLDFLGLTARFEPLDEVSVIESLGAPFEPKRSARVSLLGTDEVLGVVGEYRHVVRKNFKLPENSAGFEIDPRVVLRALAAQGIQYTPSSRYPGTERDICFQVPYDTAYSDVEDSARDALKGTDLSYTVQPVDIYHEEGSEIKNITIRIRFAAYDKTLTADDANQVTQQVITNVIQITHGKVI